MKYHVLLKTPETDELYEFDQESLVEIKETIVKPYLKKEEFQFNGYFIEPSKVKRLVISQTELSSKECVEDAYSRLSEGIFVFIQPQACVFNNERFRTDITRNTLQKEKETIE